MKNVVNITAVSQLWKLINCFFFLVFVLSGKHQQARRSADTEWQDSLKGLLAKNQNKGKTKTFSKKKEQKVKSCKCIKSLTLLWCAWQRGHEEDTGSPAAQLGWWVSEFSEMGQAHPAKLNRGRREKHRPEEKS